MCPHLQALTDFPQPGNQLLEIFLTCDMKELIIFSGLNETLLFIQTTDGNVLLVSGTFHSLALNWHLKRKTGQNWLKGEIFCTA